MHSVSKRMIEPVRAYESDSEDEESKYECVSEEEESKDDSGSADQKESRLIKQL